MHSIDWSRLPGAALMRVVVPLLAAAVVGASFAAIGAPFWLSASLGGLAALRVASGPRSAAARR